MKEKLEKFIAQILSAIGIPVAEDFIEPHLVLNQVESKKYELCGVGIKTDITYFSEDNCRIEIHFRLPEDGVLADTFMDHCAKIEHTPKNHHHEYCAGPTYPDYVTELRAKKQTFAYSPWNNTYFYVRAGGYPFNELDQAVKDATFLANQFTRHLPELSQLRFWKTDNTEVVSKAKEIIANADFYESDHDEGAHWMVDRNSFFKGWFYPFRNGGKGSFDIFIYGVDYAAIGIKGSFEYAVSCILLLDEEYIRKARKACIIRKETVTKIY